LIRKGVHDNKKQESRGDQADKTRRNHSSLLFFPGEKPEESCFHSIGQQGIEVGCIYEIDRVLGIFFRSQGVGVQLDQDNIDGPRQHGGYSVNDGVFKKTVDGVQGALIENPSEQKYDL
jgi:hypothetical protein